MTTLSPLASTLVKQLDLAPHPEGGHFRRTWTAPTDELWIWSGPGALEIHLGGDDDAPSSEPEIVILGSPAAEEEELSPSEPSNPVQFLVPAGSWQRTFARGQAALATCVVSPEFSFEDWKLASAGE